MKHLFSLFIFLLPLQTRLIFPSFSIYGTDVFLIIIFFLSLFFGNKLKDKKYYLFYIFIFFSFLSIFLASNIILAIQALWWSLACFLVIYLRDFFKIETKKIIIMFGVAIFLQGSVGAWQFFSQTDFENKWLGDSLHLINDYQVSALQFGGERWLRAYGTLDHPNILGGVLVIVSILLLSKIDDNKKYFLIIFLIFFSFITFSRSAFLALVVGLLYEFWQNKNVIILFLAIFIFSVIFWPFLSVRLNNDNALTKISNQERLELNQAALKKIKNNWFLGCGVGNVYKKEPPHNSFLLLWLERGFASLLFFGVILLQGFENKKNIGIISVVIVLMFFDHWMVNSHFGWLVLGLVLSNLDYGNN